MCGATWERKKHCEAKNYQTLMALMDSWSVVDRVCSAVIPIQQVRVETISSTRLETGVLETVYRFSHASAFLLMLIENVTSILIVLRVKSLLLLFSSFN